MTMTGSRLRGVCAVASAALLSLAGCAGKKMVMEIQGTVMYEKPAITSVSHTVTDARLEGGTVVVEITLLGDPGLRASFDISPGIATRRPMTETEDGSYAGAFSFPSDVTGGPFTIIGRLEHETAGEVIRQDPQQLIIKLVRPRG